jgi:hypothetical protein
VPAGSNGILVRIREPRDSVLKSVLLKTASGDLPLEVTDSVPLVGEYETIIDSQRINCASSGTMLLDVEGEIETRTAACYGISLPKPSSCRE